MKSSVFQNKIKHGETITAMCSDANEKHNKYIEYSMFKEFNV